jgi:hypothetical protein
MKERHLDEDEYLEEVYGDSEADRLDEHLEEIAWNDPAGGFTADEIDFLTSDESRFAWLLASDMATIRAWLDTGKDTYTQANLPDPEPEPAQHTPGPWYGEHSVYTDQGIITSESAGNTIAVCYTCKADTDLIASAPDLLAALITLAEHAQETYPHFESPRGQADIAAAWSAIYKARGE